MIEIFAFIYFINKIKSIAAEKGIEAKWWIFKLVFRWLTAEILVLSAIMYLFDIGMENEKFLLASLPAIALAMFSAYFTINQMKQAEDNFEEEEFEKQDQNFDHFR